MPNTAIRVASEKSVVIQNTGEVPSFFVIEIKQPFSVFPTRGCLQPKQTGELKITCKSSELTGTVFEDLIYICNGVRIRVSLECEIDEALIIVEKNCISFVETFMGLQDHTSVTVYNRSDYKVDYSWKKFKSYAIDQLERDKLLKALENVIEQEKNRYVKLSKMNVIDASGHGDILERNLEIDIQNAQEEVELLYQSSIFSIIPQVRTVLISIIYHHTIKSEN